MKLDRWSDRKRDLAVAAIVAVFAFCFFAPSIFSGRVFLAGDQIVYTWPLRTVAWEMIRSGQLPLWTPYVFSGYPLLSMAQLGLAYPLTWGYLFLPGHWAESVYIFAPYFLSPIFTYAFLRELGRSRLAALLGGLSFAYSGLMLSGIGLNGMLPNALMWTPLLLLAIERSRNGNFAKCVLLATAAYSMSVLSGIGQGFVFAGALAIAYALFIVLCWPKADQETAPVWRSFDRWKPLAVIVAGLLLAAGVAAFQILESRQAQRLSVRSKISYETFSEGAFRFSMAWKSWLDPFHIMGDVTAYVPLLVTLLAVVSVAAAVKQRPREQRIFFWLTVAVVGWVLMLGPNTPLFKLVYQIPVISNFRVPSRHSFEWTLAAAVMAAYGWDAVGAWLNNRQRELKNSFGQYAQACFWLAASLTICVLWFRATAAMYPVQPPSLEILHLPHLGWKLAFLATTILAIYSAWRIGNRSLRGAMLAVLIAAVCFIEPFSFVARHTPIYSSAISRLSYVAPTTKAAQQSPPEQHRAFSHFTLDADYNFDEPRLDPPNVPAVAKLHNAAGFEPLMLERYSRALNSPDWDSVNRIPWLNADWSLFQPRSQMLDVLNVTHVISYADFLYSPVGLIEKDGVEFPANPDPNGLLFNVPVSYHAKNAAADSLLIVSNLARSNHIPDGTPAARISIHTEDGSVIEEFLRAGTDTAEWAHERPDVKAKIKHSLPPIFDSRPANAENSFQSLRFLKRIKFDRQLRIVRVEVVNLLDDADVVLWHTTLFDSASRRSTQLYPIDPARWQPTYETDGTVVARNARALPRAWLATEAEALDATQVWRRLRGVPDPKTHTIAPFDPRRTALMEIEPSKLPKLEGGELPPDAYARIVSYEPNRLTIETNADRQTVLVVSEIHYPGWAARLDGAKTPIHQTDFLLRGVIVPAGKHTIEMNYRAPQARNGAIISLLTIGFIGWIGFRSRKR